MDYQSEQHYLQIAVEEPRVLCSNAPVEILEDCSYHLEPTKFQEKYFAAGHSAWRELKYGRHINLPQDLMDRAILALWYRANLVNTSRILNIESEYANQPFFSDEGLY